VLLAAAVATPALAQRDAISSALSPEAAAAAFNDAVLNACLPAMKAPMGLGSLPASVKSKFSPTNDVTTRTQAGAADDEVVWDVNAARGVVTIHEKPGRCTVSVYGPAAISTIMSLAQALTGSPGFERLASPASGLGQTLIKTDGGRRITVQIVASEPGMPAHKSRFSVVTATVFSAS
jgi:hypothetical protein